MTVDVAEAYRKLLSFDGPVQYGPGTQHPLPIDVSEQFAIQSLITMVLYPKVGKPWLFGMHQCAYERRWTAREEQLFQETSRRIEDGLTSLLSYRKLQKSEERYRLVFESSPVSLWEKDLSGVKSFLNDLKKQGVTDIETYLDQHPEALQRCANRIKILNANRASLTLLGATNKDELLAGLKNTITPEILEYFSKELVCLWNGGTEMKSDAVVKTLSGDRRMVTISFSVCPGYEKTLSRVIVSVIDITKRKAAEDALRRLNLELDCRVLERTEELEAANKEMHAFTYTVSHDLRAPLRHIDGFMELLQKTAGTAIDEQSRYYMNTISNVVQNMGLLIDDLLSFSKMGRHAMAFDTVELGPLVQEVIRDLEPDTAGRNMTWRIGDLPAVNGDAAMLRIVLSNLK
jgi:PAS domain-containing protein